MIVEEPATAPALAEALTPPPPLPAPIGFSNGLAVRAAMLAGFLALLAAMAASQLAQALTPLCFIAGGFLAVFFYEKRTGQALSVSSGARLGWLCGIFLFAVTAALLALMALILTDANTLNSFREQMKAQGAPAEAVNQILQAFRSPTSLGAGLLSSFVLFTVLASCGGALGAKLLGNGPLGNPSARD